MYEGDTSRTEANLIATVVDEEEVYLSGRRPPPLQVVGSIKLVSVGVQSPTEITLRGDAQARGNVIVA